MVEMPLACVKKQINILTNRLEKMLLKVSEKSELSELCEINKKHKKRWQLGGWMIVYSTSLQTMKTAGIQRCRSHKGLESNYEMRGVLAGNNSVKEI